MLAIKDLKKEYPTKTMGPFNFEIKQAQTVSIIGASGAGKTTLINMIVDLNKPTTGSVTLEGKKLKKKDFTYINQIGTLFGHLTIRENLNLTSKQYQDDYKTVLKQLNLDPNYLEKYPFELSGGERQRIDLARAILSKTRLIILDEALSALDTKTKDDIYEVLKTIRGKYKLFILIITHDIQEAMYLGDKILLLDQGQIVFNSTAKDFLTSDNKNILSFISNERIEILRRLFL